MVWGKLDPILIDQTSAKAWKADPGAVTWKASITNEMASAKDQAKSYAIEKPTPMEVGAAAAAGHRWVAEEAEGLFNGRGKTGRRSPQVDGCGRGRVPLFSRQGLVGASAPPLTGRMDYGRWPETSIPPRGTPTQHNYGLPTTRWSTPEAAAEPVVTVAPAAHTARRRRWRSAAER